MKKVIFLSLIITLSAHAMTGFTNKDLSKPLLPPTSRGIIIQPNDSQNPNNNSSTIVDVEIKSNDNEEKFHKEIGQDLTNNASSASAPTTIIPSTQSPQASPDNSDDEGIDEEKVTNIPLKKENRHKQLTNSWFSCNGLWSKTQTKTSNALAKIRDSKIGLWVKNKWQNYAIQNTAEAITTTGITAFLGATNADVPRVVNACALAIGGSNADMTEIQHTSPNTIERQNFFKKLIKLGVPMTVAYLVNAYLLDGSNPFPGNQFFFAICFVLANELKLLSGRGNNKMQTRHSLVPKKLPATYSCIQETIPQRARETAECITLMGGATGFGICSDTLLTPILGPSGPSPILVASIAGGNIADMFNENRPYWLRSLLLLPPAAISELINYFLLHDARLEIPTMLLIAWLKTTTKELGKRLSQNQKQSQLLAEIVNRDEEFGTSSEISHSNEEL
ncbi:hypothetical protein M1466_01560 [Candidatus Dependentiae bacterium]|nr:hypothetical protein [Candidatus Dependentiae bacterium]